MVHGVNERAAPEDGPFVSEALRQVNPLNDEAFLKTEVLGKPLIYQ
jgi:hypothetical protein